MKLPATETNQALLVKSVYIAWCASLGCLARLYTDDIRSGNIALQGSFLSNAIGSFALGILKASDLNEDNLPHIYTGVTVGLCGTYTTYSGWNLRVTRAGLRDASGPGGGIVLVVVSLLSLSLFVTCYVAGIDLVNTMASRGMLHWRGNRRALGTPTAQALGMLGCLYAVLALLLHFDDKSGRRSDWVAGMFAPLGALLRFFLSR